MIAAPALPTTGRRLLSDRTEATPPPTPVPAPPPLRCGEMVRCPHCRYAGNEEAFVRLPSGRPEFQPQTVPVWRCPACRRHFALRPTLPPSGG